MKTIEMTDLAPLAGYSLHLQGEALIVYGTIQGLLLMTYLDIVVSCVLYLLMNSGYLARIHFPWPTYLTQFTGFLLL